MATREFYDPLFKVDPKLVSGDFYQNPPVSVTGGHPFFFGPEWKTGSVCMDGTNYDSLLLRYDIYSNQLILNTIKITGHYLQITLNTYKIDSFSLDKRLFKPYPIQKGVTTRFCEVLSGTPAALLVLKTKRLKVPADGSSPFAYETSEIRNMLVDDELIRYRGRQTLYRLYPHLRKNLQDYIRSEQLKLGGRQVDGHARLVNYCNSLATRSK